MTSTGTRGSAALTMAAPASSVSTATAPAATASGAKRAPWWVKPGSATNISPRATSEESTLTPTTARPSGASAPEAGRSAKRVARSLTVTGALWCGRSAAADSYAWLLMVPQSIVAGK